MVLRASPQTASVVIPSYNYGRFLRNAIESCLGQSRPPYEVIVVDDGSVDDSVPVIESFGARIRAVVKENGGHASAINAGCRLARGEAVFLLDADDEMQPHAIETVLAAWRPETVMIHWRPSQIDADGREIAGTVPAPWIPLEQGDMRQQLLKKGGFTTTVTSGLALRTDVLRQVLPIPEDTFRQGADGYLVRAVAFLGPVQAIDRPLTRYRRHGDNDSDLGSSPDRVAAGLRRRIEFARNEVGVVPQLARAHGLQTAPALGETDPEYLFNRLGSLKVDPGNHPLATDSVRHLLPRLVAAQLRSRRSVDARVVAVCFSLALALLPRRFAWRLLVWRNTPSARPGWLARLASLRHRPILR